MVFFRKNKRHFVYRSQRRVFVALFLFVFLATTIVSLISKVSAETTPVASVSFYSQNTDFNNVDPGAWKITKSAEWIDEGKARITFDIVSRNFIDNRAKDIVLLTENSWSMEGWKSEGVKADATQFVEDILGETENTVALITFNETATLLSDFSDDIHDLQARIRNISNYGCTSFYQALLRLERLLDDHTFDAERDTVVIFLADGSPCIDTPNEVAEYRTIKAKYPNVIFNSIQYEDTEEISETLVNISEYQYIAKSGQLGSVLAQAAKTPYEYDNFVLTDYIEDEYWTISGADAITVPYGSVSLTYENETPKIVWNLSEIYRLGTVARMTINVDLKSAYLNATDLLLPTNKQTIIESSLDGVPDENVSENTTPKLKDVYQVSYSANAPSGCTATGTVPTAVNYSIYSTVEMPDNDLYCEGYNFQGWAIGVTGVTRTDDSHFVMPAMDVEINGVWSKLSISKSMEGDVNTRAFAMFDTGSVVNVKIRNLAGENIDSPYVEGSENQSYNETITNIARSDILPGIVDESDEKYILSSADSPVPIYGWFNGGTLYYYTDADDIYLNPDASFMFMALNVLQNINALRAFDASRTTNMMGMFTSPNVLYTDLEPIRYWDVSHVTNMSGMFNSKANTILSIDALEDWDVSSVEYMTGMFAGHLNFTDLQPLAKWKTGNVKNMANMFGSEDTLTNLTGLEDWDVSSVQNMSAMFGGGASDHLTSLEPLADWNTSNVTNMAGMFYSELGWNDEREQDYGFSSVHGLENWDVRKVETMAGMFEGINNLTDIDALANWETDSLTDINSLFYQGSLTNVDALANWNVSKVTNMGWVFYQNKPLQNIDGLSEWDTGKVENFKSAFCLNTNLSNISGLSGWDTSSAINTQYMFYATGITNLNSTSGWRFNNLTTSSWMFGWADQLTDVSGAHDWGMSKVENMDGMFYGTTSLSDITALDGWTTSSLTSTRSTFSNTSITNIGTMTVDEETGEISVSGGLSTWDMSHVTDMGYMFSFATKLKNIDGARKWVTTSLVNMEWMFNEANKLESVEGARGWDVSKVTNMGWLFDANYSLLSIEPLSDWNTESLTTMSNTFSNLSKITSLEGLRNWKTGKVTNMYSAIDFTSSLHSLDGLENWDVSKVTNMGHMFRGSKIENLDALANWHPDKVTSMTNMFKEASQLSDISGLSGWFSTDETSKITSVEGLFEKTKITNVDALANWKTPNLTNMKSMFWNVTTLTNVDGLEHWNTAKVTTVENIFSGDTGLTAANAFEKLNDWDTTKLTNTTNAFLDVPDTAVRPTWYVEPAGD